MSEKRSFVSRVQPINIVIVSASADFSRKEYWRLAEQGPVDRVITARYELGEHSDDYFDVVASFEFMLGLMQPESGTKLEPISTPIRIACRFEGHFHLEGAFDPDEADGFVRGNAWVIFWPYFRQYVSDATARMSVPPEVLPLGLGPGRFALPGMREKTTLVATKKRKKAVSPKKG